MWGSDGGERLVCLKPEQICVVGWSFSARAQQDALLQ